MSEIQRDQVSQGRMPWWRHHGCQVGYALEQDDDQAEFWNGIAANAAIEPVEHRHSVKP